MMAMTLATGMRRIAPGASPQPYSRPTSTARTSPRQAKAAVVAISTAPAAISRPARRPRSASSRRAAPMQISQSPKNAADSRLTRATRNKKRKSAIDLGSGASQR